MADKQTTEDAFVATLRDGMTLGIGGWGSRRKPMSLVRALLRSPLRDLRIVSFGGPDVGLLCASGKVCEVHYGFVSMDSVPLEPQFRKAREEGRITAREWDEGMMRLGLMAAAWRLPHLPTRAGMGSDVERLDPTLQRVTDPYTAESLLAVPAIPLDVACIHVNRADTRGNGLIFGPDPFFDTLFCQAAERTVMCCEAVVSTEVLLEQAKFRSQDISRMWIDAVVEAPQGAHFTSCPGDYGRDEAFQKAYARASRDADDWEAFSDSYLRLPDEASYREAVANS